MRLFYLHHSLDAGKCMRFCCNFYSHRCEIPVLFADCILFSRPAISGWVLCELCAIGDHRRVAYLAKGDLPFTR